MRSIPLQISFLALLVATNKAKNRSNGAIAKFHYFVVFHPERGRFSLSDSIEGKRRNMSIKIFKKRIALVATAALGFGLMSVVPASAAFTGLATGAAGLTLTTPTVNIALGDVATTTFQVATTGTVAADDDIDYSLGAITEPDADSALTVVDAAGTAAATDEVKLVTGTSVDGATDWSTEAGAGAASATVVDTAGDAGTALTLANVRGLISMKPAVVGTYTVTLTATPSEGTARTAIFQVIVTAAASGLAVTSSSAASLDATFGTVSNVKGQAAFQTSVQLPASAIGRSLYTEQNGFIGTIATIVTGGTFGGTFAAVTTTPSVTTVVGFLGTRSTTTVANGLVAGQITGMTVTAGRTVALNVALQGSAFQTGRTRANLIGIGVTGTSVAAASGENVNSLITFTAPVRAGGGEPPGPCAGCHAHGTVQC